MSHKYSKTKSEIKQKKTVQSDMAMSRKLNNPIERSYIAEATHTPRGYAKDK